MERYDYEFIEDLFGGVELFEHQMSDERPPRFGEEDVFARLGLDQEYYDPMDVLY